MTSEPVHVGIDVGSTTVKTVALEQGHRIVWRCYERHETRQAEVVRRQLGVLQDQFSGRLFRLFLTGSGATTLAPIIKATFVQEVNAVEMAVDTLLPGSGSVVELGGQDAKIIVWKTDAAGNRRSAITMNDKCAGGTGATIDRILAKAGVAAERAASIPYCAERIHKIAARCGVFAETDVVCLLKAGTPEREIVASLFAAIVKQNLEVLTRGNLLRERVVLLGGPNRFFAGLVQCWRREIPIHWRERGHLPPSAPPEELIYCPDDAEYFAAIGAVLYGREQLDYGLAGVGAMEQDCSLEQLDQFIDQGRGAQLSLSNRTRPPLVASDAEKEAFVSRYSPPEFVPYEPLPGETVRAYLGIDGGSTSTKAVLLSPDGELLSRAYNLSAGNPLHDTRLILRQLRAGLAEQGAELEVLGAGATGYAGRILGQTLGLDAVVVETVAHMLSALRYYGAVDVICDVGGQDIKILFLREGRLKDYRFNTQCSAGNGYFLQTMAQQFNVPLEQFAERAFSARLAPAFHYGCAVFMEQDKVNLQQLGWSPEEMLAGLALVLPLNIWQYVAQVADLQSYGRRFVLQGGTQKNLAAVKAQVDYIRERVPEAEVFVHRHAAESGAIGAALEAMVQVERRGESRFVGLDQAIGLTFESRTDEETRCTSCSNGCRRSFIDVSIPGGRNVRYISGFACDKGSVESRSAMKALAADARRQREGTPNLVDEAYHWVFGEYDSHLVDGNSIPDRPWPPSARGRLRALWPSWRHQPRKRSAAALQARAALRVGLPRALTLYHSAPFFSTFLKALGVGEVLFSRATTDKLWERGGKWGTIDPCFPAKVANAHVQDLLFHQKVDAIFFPMVECLESHLEDVRGTWACTLQTSTPEVVAASFTKVKDYFAAQGVDFWKPLVNLERRRECADTLFNYFKDRLLVTREEVDQAAEQGYRALETYRRHLRARGASVIQEAVARNDIVLVSLSRPYHNDPGMNHGILTKFQRRGYPVIGLESLPVDDDFLRPLFGNEGPVRGVLDVWKRAYNYGANHKLWAAKVIAHHPNLVALELTSFKCGYDYSISSYLEQIASAAGSPYFMFHDLDQNRSESALDLRIESIAYFLEKLKNGLQRKGTSRSFETRAARV
jgi:activator of 2-hydroxyglutaryl-CoA dehydratase/predicted nucleotide-binding protein (sugar kinase/HSP70/actin superfamily)